MPFYFRDAPEEYRARDRRLLWLAAPLVLVLVALVGVLYVGHDFAQVDGTSMEPSLHDEDRLLITLEYRTPARGDVVEIVSPTGDGTDDVRLIKRVVGIAGDRVSFEGDAIRVDGRLTPYPAHILGYENPVGELTVPDGHVFVAGDNRPVSLDSRFFGPVPLEVVTGRAITVFLPLHRLGWID
jgi:signal peptidase I